MRIMEYLPKEDQKNVALTDKKHNRMAYAFNFWYYDTRKRKAALPAQTLAMLDKNRKALPQDRDPLLAQKMAALYASVPKGIEKEVTKFCTPLGLGFLSKVEDDLTKCEGRRTVEAIKAGHVGENLFRALSSFRQVVLPLIEKQIDIYNDDMVDVLIDAYNTGKLKELVSEYRDQFVEEYKIKQAWKGVDVREITDVTDDVLFQCATEIATDYIKNKPQQDSECQRFKAVKARLIDNVENNLKSVSPQPQAEPLSLSPSLSPR